MIKIKFPATNNGASKLNPLFLKLPENTIDHNTPLAEST